MSKVPAEHPMAVVTRRTGLRADVIRAWERRHQAVMPCRSAGNRRLYTDDDIRRLGLIRRTVEAGWQIGQVAHLTNADLEERIDQSVASTAPVASGPAPVGSQVERHLERCLAFVRELDGDSLARQLEAASVELSRVDLIERLLIPMMEGIGTGWIDGRLRTAHEHLGSVVLRSFLDTMRSAYPDAERDPGIVVTTPAFQHHELAAMLVATTARIEGWRTTYLGPNLPAEEMVAAVRQRGARILALSITFPADDPVLEDELRRIGRLLGHGAELIVGGRSAHGYADAIDEIGAVRLNKLADLREYLGASRLRSPRLPGSVR